MRVAGVLQGRRNIKSMQFTEEKLVTSHSVNLRIFNYEIKSAVLEKTSLREELNQEFHLRLVHRMCGETGCNI